jgi:peptide/nickel transport system substrate-binding protein
MPLSIAYRLAPAALATFLAAAPAGAETVVKMIPQADLKILDSVWTTAAVSQNHALLIYDMLFGMDENMRPQPQMVETWTKSEDGLKWSFTLRSGMKFHDGSPVRAKDAVASVKRWSQRQPSGIALMQRAESLEATGELTFELKLKEKFGPVLEVFADPSLPLPVMREQEASIDGFTQIKETIGSGPFMFVKEEWVPGNKVVYKKNPDYKPRAEPPSGFAGGKVAKVDRVEWIYIPDNATATAALQRGEMDIFEQPTYDLLPILAKDKNITVKVLDPVGKFGTVRPNFLHPPFDNAKARQALQLLVDQKMYLAAMVGNPQYEKECYAVFVCGSPLATEAYSEPWRKQNIAKAKELFKEAGYNGEPIVVLQPTDQTIIFNISAVTADLLKQAGVNVDLQASDWGTVTTRRTSKEKPGPGSPGWHIFTTWWTGLPVTSPITATPLVSTCDGKNWFGWSCDDEIEKLRAEFITAGDADRLKVVDKLQKRYYEVFPYIMTGQFLAPFAWRNSVTGVVNAPLFVFWGLEKKA